MQNLLENHDTKLSVCTNFLGCVLEGLRNKKERDKIGKEGEK